LALGKANDAERGARDGNPLTNSRRVMSVMSENSAVLEIDNG
jgi:hypothetical protein